MEGRGEPTKTNQKPVAKLLCKSVGIGGTKQWHLGQALSEAAL